MLYFLIYKFINLKKIKILVYFIPVLAAFAYTIHPDFISRVLMYFSLWWAGVELADMYLKQTEFKLKNFKLPLFVLMIITSILLIKVLMVYKVDELHGLGVHPILEFRHFVFGIIAIILAFIWKKSQWIGFDVTIGKLSRAGDFKKTYNNKDFYELGNLYLYWGSNISSLGSISDDSWITIDWSDYIPSSSNAILVRADVTNSSGTRN